MQRKIYAHELELEKLQKITNASKKSQIKQNLKVSGFSIDTRSLQSGELFCALKGNGKTYANKGNFNNHMEFPYLYQIFLMILNIVF